MIFCSWVTTEKKQGTRCIRSSIMHPFYAVISFRKNLSGAKQVRNLRTCYLCSVRQAGEFCFDSFMCDFRAY